MRIFYLVTNHESHDCELVLADGHVDALSYYRKKHKLEPGTTLSCSDYRVTNGDERFPVTKLSELPDNSVFYKVLEALGYCTKTPVVKIATMANGMVRCRFLDDMVRPDAFFKGSTKVAVLSTEEQECLKSGKA